MQVAKLLVWTGRHMAWLWPWVILEGTAYIPYFLLKSTNRTASGHTAVFAELELGLCEPSAKRVYVCSFLQGHHRSCFQQSARMLQDKVPGKGKGTSSKTNKDGFYWAIKGQMDQTDQSNIFCKGFSYFFLHSSYLPFSFLFLFLSFLLLLPFLSLLKNTIALPE